MGYVQKPGNQLAESYGPMLFTIKSIAATLALGALCFSAASALAEAEANNQNCAGGNNNYRGAINRGGNIHGDYGRNNQGRNYHGEYNHGEFNNRGGYPNGGRQPGGYQNGGFQNRECGKK